MKRKRVDYSKLKVVCSATPCDKALQNYCNIVIDYQIKTYGKRIVKKALEVALEQHKIL